MLLVLGRTSVLAAHELIRSVCPAVDGRRLPRASRHHGLLSVVVVVVEAAPARTGGGRRGQGWGRDGGGERQLRVTALAVVGVVGRVAVLALVLVTRVALIVRTGSDHFIIIMDDFLVKFFLLMEK